MVERKRDSFEKFVRFATPIVVAVATPIIVAVVSFGAWQGRRAIDALGDHESRIVNVEAVRFTADDAAKARARDREDMKEFIRLNIEPIRKTVDEIKAGVKENREAIRDSM